jgi:hypothetical protein
MPRNQQFHGLTVLAGTSIEWQSSSPHQANMDFALLYWPDLESRC